MLGLLVKYSYQSSLVIRRDGMNGQWCSRESSNPPCSLKSSFKKCTSSAAANFLKGVIILTDFNTLFLQVDRSMTIMMAKLNKITKTKC